MDALSALGGSSGQLPTLKQQQLGQDEFMTLMLAQFNAQNPLEPMDNTEFLGQLAQFSVVSGVQQLDASFQSLAAGLTGEQVLQGASLLGKPVQHYSDQVLWDGEQPAAIAVDLPPGATDVEVDITNTAGQRVAQLRLPADGGDELRLAWDGSDAAGAPLPAGSYSVSARAFSGNQATAVATRVESRVTAVLPSAQGLYLELDGGIRLPVTEIVQLRAQQG